VYLFNSLVLMLTKVDRCDWTMMSTKDDNNAYIGCCGVACMLTNI